LAIWFLLLLLLDAQHHVSKLALTAIIIAIWLSVTVSIGDETRGAFNEIFLVRADIKSYNGNNRTVNKTHSALTINQSINQSIFI